MMDDVFSKYLILYRRNSCKSMCEDRSDTEVARLDACPDAFKLTRMLDY
jgi:hypothetical protein